MKIFEIGTGYTPIPAKIGAATEIVVEELTRAFCAQGICAEIIDIQSHFRPKTDLTITEVPVPKCFTGTDLRLGLLHKAKRVVYSIALAEKLKRIIKQSTSKPVLHFHNQYNLFFFLKLTSRSLRRKCTIIYTNHSGIWRLPWSEIENTVQRRYFQEAECMKQADIVFALNQETIINASNHLNIPREHFIRIDNGVNTNTYHPLSEKEKCQAKDRFGLTGKRIILQVGSVYENKGQARSLTMLAPLLKQHEDLIYAYAGGIVSEEYQQQVQALAKEMQVENQVRYLGIIAPGAALNQLYNVAEACIFASHFESFGLVIIESLSAGTPVLIDQSTPFFFGEGCIPYTNSNFSTICTDSILCSSNKQALSAASRKNVQQHYSWNAVAQAYLSALE